MTSLNPYMRVGEQLMEVLMLHKKNEQKRGV
ncbi:oligopeptide transporter ATP-binding component [Serratia fonticola]|uniref:Oligopeptide transporter ATP-binding component n=1 Tax=Serratia fonticola TaxID=47917 RepID=A0A4U9VB80_SERFO|nr:oligopeptide transporter ATP-binding component [Serratia fonticola]